MKTPGLSSETPDFTENPQDNHLRPKTFCFNPKFSQIYTRAPQISNKIWGSYNLIC